MNQNIQNSFDEQFYKYKNMCIAIYGTGRIAKKILNNDSGYNFFAVVDEKYKHNAFEGHPVKPIADVVDKVKLLIIAAAEKNVEIIYQRIKVDLPDSLLVLSSRGYQIQPNEACDNPYWSKSLEGLKKEIGGHDVISFDVFDTLIMRRTLQPHDVHELVQRDLLNEGVDIPYSRWLIDAETHCDRYYTFDDIYEKLTEEHSDLPRDFWNSVKQRELEYEKHITMARKDVVEAYNYAKNAGKCVGIISDMYLPKDFLKSVLRREGIVDYDFFYLSCEKKIEKISGEAYKALRKEYPNQKILHVGDNHKSDVVQAQKAGVDAYRIYSAYDMLRESRLSYLLDKVRSLYDRVMLGDVVAYLLNSPFALHDGKGKLYFKDAEAMAIATSAGIMMRFLQFIACNVSKENNDVVLFVSRDCYFLQEVWERLRQKDSNLPESVYFYSSRKASTGACVIDKCDIDVLLSDIDTMDQDEMLKHFLEHRFQVSFPDVAENLTCRDVARVGRDRLLEIVTKHEKDILQSSEKRRSGYLKYIENLGIKNKNMCLVDTVTRGTVAYALRRMTGKTPKLLTYSLLFYPNKYVDGRSVASIIVNGKQFSLGFSYFNIIELVFASSENQLSEFDENGNPLFVPNTAYSYELLSGIQKSLSYFVDKYPDKDWIHHEVSDALAEGLVALLDPRFSDVAEELNGLFDVYDPLSAKPKKNLLKMMRW